MFNKWILVLLLLVGCGENSSTFKLPDKVKCPAIVMWEAPTETTDGTPLTTNEVEKFTIYISKVNDVDENTLTSVTDITDVNLTVWEMRVNPGPNYFYMTVTTKDGNISTYSNILQKNCTP